MSVVTALSTLTGIVLDVPDKATAAAMENSLSATLPGVADVGIGQDDDCGGGNFLAGYGILIQDESGDDEGSRRKKAKRGSSHSDNAVVIVEWAGLVRCRM